jgi:hypothetical protein
MNKICARYKMMHSTFNLYEFYDGIGFDRNTPFLICAKKEMKNDTTNCNSFRNDEEEDDDLDGLPELEPTSPSLEIPSNDTTTSCQSLSKDIKEMRRKDFWVLGPVKFSVPSGGKYPSYFKDMKIRYDKSLNKNNKSSNF